jgi:AbiJ N-terminal domain 4
LKTLLRERGVFTLSEKHNGFGEWELAVADYFLNEHDIEKAIDVVEVVFEAIYSLIEKRGHFLEQSPESAIAELNGRFKEHGVGYQFESGRIIRVDSQFEHEDVVKPALALLRDPDFKGPNAEFLRAHEHHRQGRQEECLVDCLKAFESTMKVICDQRRWPYDKSRATSKDLIGIVLTKELVPLHFQNEFTGLRTMLESGVPAVRNKNAAHGGGGQVRKVPPYLASFALHSTAANILLLIEANKVQK